MIRKKLINNKKMKSFFLLLVLIIINLVIIPGSILTEENSINVNVNIIENYPPFIDDDPNPENGKIAVPVNPLLEIIVKDPNNDSMDVYFYNALNDELIGLNKNVSSGSVATISWSNLSYFTTYSWYVIVNDTYLFNISNVWSFTTKRKSSNPITNIPPVADASKSQKFGVVNEEIQFDATDSYDPDGSIVNYTWDFQDGEKGYGKKIKHNFSSEGTYDVILTVEDDEGSTDYDSIIIDIAKLNNPPSKPIVEGIDIGHQNKNYSFLLSSTDPEDDRLSYYIDWGDGNSEIKSFYQSGKEYNISHNWTFYGEYTIIVYVKDNETISESTYKTIYIDVLPIDEAEVKGYLIDEDSDDIYTLYNNTNTGVKTIVKLDNITYLIDNNNDSKWDYAYNTNSGLSIYYLYLYNKYYTIYLETPGFDINLLLCVFVLFIFMIYIRKKK